MNNNKSRKFSRARREKPEFDQKLLDLARVTRVVKGGRRFSFRATVVIGNRKGKVGVGVAKGADVSDAVSKAVADAKKSMIVVKRTNTSIAHEIREKLGAAKVLLKPAKEGKGIVAGGAMRSVIDLAGIKDITAKSLGSSNKINVARATIKALSKIEPRRQEGITIIKEDKKAKVEPVKEVSEVAKKPTEKETSEKSE
jgi:small subunit ribosomal protein S5